MKSNVPVPGFPLLSEKRRKSWEEFIKAKEAGSPQFLGPRRNAMNSPALLPVTVINSRSFFAVLSNDRASLNVIGMEGGDWSSYSMPKGTHGFPLHDDGELLAMAVSGAGIREFAVFCAKDQGKWYVQNLREPAGGEFIPEMSPGLVSYIVGNDVYAFSAEAQKWDMLHLDGTAKPIVGHGSGAPYITVRQDDMVYVFRPRLGAWSRGRAQASGSK
jgi:hypothetical protein